MAPKPVNVPIWSRPMKPIDAEQVLRDNVRRLLQTRSSQSEVAKAIGIADSTLSQFLNGRHSLGLSRLGALAAALDTNVAALFDATAHRDLPRQTPEEQSASQGTRTHKAHDRGKFHSEKLPPVVVESVPVLQGGASDGSKVGKTPGNPIFDSHDDAIAAVRNGLVVLTQMLDAAITKQKSARRDDAKGSSSRARRVGAAKPPVAEDGRRHGANNA